MNKSLPTRVDHGNLSASTHSTIKKQPSCSIARILQLRLCFTRPVTSVFNIVHMHAGDLLSYSHIEGHVFSVSIPGNREAPQQHTDSRGSMLPMPAKKIPVLAALVLLSTCMQGMHADDTAGSAGGTGGVVVTTGNSSNGKPCGEGLSEARCVLDECDECGQCALDDAAGATVILICNSGAVPAPEEGADGVLEGGGEGAEGELPSQLHMFLQRDTMVGQ